jgi:hypothetical protein
LRKKTGRNGLGGVYPIPIHPDGSRRDVALGSVLLTQGK